MEIIWHISNIQIHQICPKARAVDQTISSNLYISIDPQKEFSWRLLASRFHSTILTIQTPTDPIWNTMTKQNYVKCQEISKTQTSDSFVFVQTLIVQFLWAVLPMLFHNFETFGFKYNIITVRGVFITRRYKTCMPCL